MIRRRFFSAIAAAAALGAVGSPSAVAQDAGAADAGGVGSLTAAGCGTCHGTDGLGTAAGPSIATDELSVAEFIAYVRRPRGSMPAYSAQAVSDQVLTEIRASLEPSPAQPLPVGRAEVGGALYRGTGCYQCHADQAQGGAQGPRLGPNPITFARFSWYVRHPTGGMPPYTSTVMSDQDLADVYAFIEARPAPPPVSSIELLAP